MSRRAALLAAWALASCVEAQPSADIVMAPAETLPGDPARPQLITTQFTGPGMVCGIGFAIALAPDEKITRYDTKMDFVTYRLEGPGRAVVVYEGNAPQDADAYIETGRSFPSVVAVHLDAGGYERSLARRILTKDDIPQACAAAQVE